MMISSALLVRGRNVNRMLIDFDKFVRKIESNFDMQDTLYDVMPCHIIDLAKECEADDSAPVVRCKDCLHGAWRGSGYYCGKLDHIFEPNFYCAGGERIE